MEPRAADEVTHSPPGVSELLSGVLAFEVFEQPGALAEPVEAAIHCASQPLTAADVWFCQVAPGAAASTAVRVTGWAALRGLGQQIVCRAHGVDARGGRSARVCGFMSPDMALTCSFSCWTKPRVAHILTPLTLSLALGG
jgi:hypothetical protein